jgi:ribosomal protein S18 acetylase RimI-like enzyme
MAGWKDFITRRRNPDVRTSASQRLIQKGSEHLKFSPVTVETPTETYTIRAVEETDLPALEWEGEFSHFRLVFRQAFEDMRSGTRLLLVMERQTLGDLIGQIFLQFSSSDPRFADGRGRGYLYALRVKSLFRRQGLGTQLIRAAEGALISMGMHSVSIGVAKENPGARALYERLGYRILADLPGEWSFIDHLGQSRLVVEPAWLMEKQLDTSHT